jgi:hypothetical protein
MKLIQTLAMTLVWIPPKHDPPPHLALIVGDCVHNLRATLDNLVTALPGADPERASFVLLDKAPVDDQGNPVAFAKRVSRVKGIDPAAVSIIESLQPYQATDSAYASRIPIGIQLQRLNALWNSDKHREPTVVLSSLRSTVLSAPSDPGWLVTDPYIGPIQKRQLLWRVVWLGEGPAPRTPYEAGANIDIAFGSGPVAGDLVEHTLVDLHNCIRQDVLPLFAPFIR